ncbi:MAG: RTA1 like protein-domain-containing protein [Benniella sp.]|nr:MAG: RTA1 like protein-domain-containing protein [Benniella sp.]
MLFLLAPFLLLADSVLAQSQSGRRSILRYEPSLPGNIIFGILFAILGILFSYHIHKHKDRWALCLPIGAIASALGYFLKLALDPDNFSLMLYVLQNALIVISPCAFLAFNYMLYGRFITAIDPIFDIHSPKQNAKMTKSRFSFIPPRIVGRTFVWSDVITFLVQMAAGGMQAAGSKGGPSLSKLGYNLFLAGVTIQGISYCLFTVLLTVALKRLIDDRRTNPVLRGNTWMGLDRNTTLIVAGLYISSLFIIIRSIYRIVEFAEGYDGYLIGQEVYLFVLDAAPLAIAIGVFAFIWPPVLLDTIASQTRQAEQNHTMETGSASIPNINNNKSEWVPLV